MKSKYFTLALIGLLLAFQSCEKENQEDYQLESVNARSSFGLTANFVTSVRIFNNQAFVTFFNASRAARTFEWSFPGAAPESSTLRNPQAVYTQNGTFNVTLVTTGRGDTKSITKQVVITGIEGGDEIVDDQENDGIDQGGDDNVPEEVVQVSARFFASVRLVNNQAQVTLNNRSQNATNFQWSFPGGTPSSSNLENPVVTFPTNGTFAITLVASNGDVSDTVTQNISINNIPEEEVEEPVVDVRARFFVSIRRSNGQFQVTMRNRSTNATDFQWSFPGGSPETSTEENPTVIYTEGGSKTITLVASNGDVTSTRTVRLSL